jgi:hypothetical protein
MDKMKWYAFVFGQRGKECSEVGRTGSTAELTPYERQRPFFTPSSNWRVIFIGEGL